MPESISPAADYVERSGLHWEAEGLPRIAGRILGYLTLQPAAVSLDDLASALGVSKASVSTDARHLERLSLIERRSRPADRRDYYAIAEDMPARVVSLKLAELERLHDVLSDVSALPITDEVVHARLVKFGAFQEHAMKLLRILLADLQASASSPPPRTSVNPS
jgi:DNA-binding MarR family transcriptional regulator